MTKAILFDLTEPLSTLLREGTKQAHTEAETSQGARLLLGGKLPKDEYVRFLMMLWYLYDAVEAALDKHAAFPTLEPTYNPTLLARAPALSADISYLLDVPEDSWKSHPIHKDLVTPSLPPSLQTYLTRLRTLANSPDPSPLLAHSYVRYLGDLSGGQSIRRIVSKAYGLEEDGQEGKELGVSFYVFKELRGSKEATIGEMKRIKDWFREGMNLAGERCTDDNAKLAIVEEASNAFRLNMGLFSAIRMPAQDEPKSTPNGSSTAAGKRKVKPSEVVKGDEPKSGWPMSSVAAVIVAMCAAHFILVVGGFTGTRGYEKLLAVDQWLSDLLGSRSE